MSGGAKDRECLVQGTIDDTTLPILETHLKGLCRVFQVPFHYREIVFKSPVVPGVPPSELRARCDFKSDKKTGRWYCSKF